MKNDHLLLYDRKGNLVVRTKRSNNRLYKVILEVESIKCLKMIGSDEASLWHSRLGHVNVETMKMMANKELVVGLPKMATGKETCESCMRGKQTRASFPQSSTYRATQPLELIHGDLCGPITPTTPAGKKYIFVLIDDYSRYMWSILLKNKSEAFEKFKTFKSQAEQETREHIQTFRTDRGGEFTSKEFQGFCELNGIKRHLTAPYSPQQNGVVERRNRTLLEMTRSILKAMNLPNYLWGEATRHATYLINRVATRSLTPAQTPYEVLRGRKPNLGHIRVFGCIGHVRTEAVGRRKLDDRSKMLVHLGTEPGSKAYRFLDPTSRKIIVSRDVVFDEYQSWNWNGKTEVSNGGTGGSGLRFEKLGSQGMIGDVIMDEYQDNNDSTRVMSGTEQHTDVVDEETEEVEETEEIETEDDEEQQSGPRRSTRTRRLPDYLNEYVCLAEIDCERLLMLINEEPWDFTEARAHKEWIIACEDEIESIIKNKTWDLVELPLGPKQ